MHIMDGGGVIAFSAALLVQPSWVIPLPGNRKLYILLPTVANSIVIKSFVS